jgi:hypothetical protein
MDVGTVRLRGEPGGLAVDNDVTVAHRAAL